MSGFSCANQWLSTHLSIFYYFIVLFGFAAIFKVFMTIVQGIRKLFRNRINFRQRYGQNAWALVTGGSEGIGRQLACQLAGQGMNIVLLARTQSKLKFAQEYIQKKHPNVKVQYVMADLMKQGQKQNINQVVPQLQKYDFSIVVNNAGVDLLDHYKDIPIKTIIDLININCFSLLALNYKFSKKFDQKVNRGQHCAILNVASFAGQIPVPFFDVYSASKAYVLRLTRCLAIDMPGIDWLVLNPSQVQTAMTGFKNDILTVSAQSCAAGTLNDWGHQLMTNGHIAHKIQSFLQKTLPQSVFYFLWFSVFAPTFLAQRKKWEEQLKKNKEK